jgi:DNA-binding transcriptional ArsR family regulator
MTERNDLVFRARANPSRRLLLDKLFEDDGQTLGALCEGLRMTRQAVTQHLAALEAASLIVTVWHGREKLHSLDTVPIRDLADRLHDNVSFGWPATMSVMKTLVEAAEEAAG